MRTALSSAIVLAAFTASGLLGGCGTGVIATPTAQPLKVAGSVYGGALPINGSHIYLYAANPQVPSGPGIAASSLNASQSLLVAGANTTRDSAGKYYVTGGVNGQFSLSTATCTTGQELYLYSTGGNARGGSPTGSGVNDGVNAAIGLLADLGECSQVGGSVVVSELTTVAAAYAVAGFATDATHIGDDEGILSNNTAAVAKTGMANAFANAKNLVTQAGTALTTTPGGNGTVPTATLNTIANILAGCVQSTGPTSKPCSDLFNFTGTALSSDTATAAINLAHDPLGANTVTSSSGSGSGSGAPGVTAAQLFSDLEAGTDFVPNLAQAPQDYSIAILYTGTGIKTPVGVAVDANGSVWIADSGSSSVVELSGANASYSGTQYTGGGLSTPNFIAIDTNGSAWATNPGSITGTLTELTGSGTSYTPTPYTGSASAPTQIAIDGNNRVWISDGAGLSVVFTSIGLTYAPYALPVLNGNDATSVSIDANENAYFTNTNKSLARIPSLAENNYLVVDLSASQGSLTKGAINNDGNLWIENGSKSNFSIVTFTGNSTTVTATTSGTDTYEPSDFIFDALGNPWAVCNLGGYICHLDTGGSGQVSSLQGTTGDGTSGTVITGSTNQLAFDNAGNLWVSNANNVAEFVGAGLPVVTPLVGAVVANKISARP